MVLEVGRPVVRRCKAIGVAREQFCEWRAVASDVAAGDATRLS